MLKECTQKYRFLQLHTCPAPCFPSNIRGLTATSTMPNNSDNCVPAKDLERWGTCKILDCYVTGNWSLIGKRKCKSVKFVRIWLKFVWKSIVFIPECFHGLPPNDCGVENAMAVGRSCTEDTTVVTRSHQYQYATTTKIWWKTHMHCFLKLRTHAPQHVFRATFWGSLQRRLCQAKKLCACESTWKTRNAWIYWLLCGR